MFGPMTRVCLLTGVIQPLHRSHLKRTEFIIGSNNINHTRYVVNTVLMVDTKKTTGRLRQCIKLKREERTINCKMTWLFVIGNSLRCDLRIDDIKTR